MLQTKTINPKLFRILKALMDVKAFNNLLLVGGTSLALQIGHRESIDIDLFGNIDFNFDEYSETFSNIGNTKKLKLSKNINIITIDDIKIDFVNYRYGWLKKNHIIDSIRLASLEDIAAMKLNAIVGRGTKKDFIDIYFLLKNFSLNQIIDFYTEKFDDGNLFLVKKSILYFEDADKDPMPKLMDSITWSEIKNEIIKIFNLNFN